jgi:hypothetical protein
MLEGESDSLSSPRQCARPVGGGQIDCVDQSPAPNFILQGTGSLPLLPFALPFARGAGD